MRLHVTAMQSLSENRDITHDNERLQLTCLNNIYLSVFDKHYRLCELHCFRKKHYFVHAENPLLLFKK